MSNKPIPQKVYAFLIDMEQGLVNRRPRECKWDRKQKHYLFEFKRPRNITNPLYLDCGNCGMIRFPFSKIGFNTDIVGNTLSDASYVLFSAKTYKECESFMAGIDMCEEYIQHNATIPMTWKGN